MPIVQLHPFNAFLEAQEGENLFTLIRRHAFPLAASCDGDGTCDKCRVLVLRGSDKLTEPTAIERQFMNERGYLPNERLSCQVRILGDVTVTTTYW